MVVILNSSQAIVVVILNSSQAIVVVILNSSQAIVVVILFLCVLVYVCVTGDPQIVCVLIGRSVLVQWL